MSDENLATGPIYDLVAEYHEWLVAERGLAESTVEYYMRGARLFLEGRDRSGLAVLSLGEVSAFMVGECRRLSVGAAKNLAVALRSLLRYLHMVGVVDRELAQAVPAPASWRGRWLPRGLGAEEVAALLAASDHRTAIGRRDHAIVMILARLGLRAAEVSGLGLDDLDWARGEMTVLGKGNHSELLPLPVDVGEALVAYLEYGRPNSSCRAVFLRAFGPPVGLSAAAVTSVVRRACVRAGLSPRGAHRLRHSAATALLRAGGSLDEVGQVLRHRDLATTSAYAKVDFAALRTVALRWPERVA
jgi:integrase/recombinase XerD